MMAPLITSPSGRAQRAEHETQGLLLEGPRGNDGPGMMHRAGSGNAYKNIISLDIGATVQAKETASKEMPSLAKQALS